MELVIRIKARRTRGWGK